MIRLQCIVNTSASCNTYVLKMLFSLSLNHDVFKYIYIAISQHTYNIYTCIIFLFFTNSSKSLLFCFEFEGEKLFL